MARCVSMRLFFNVLAANHWEAWLPWTDLDTVRKHKDAAAFIDHFFVHHGSAIVGRLVCERIEGQVQGIDYDVDCLGWDGSWDVNRTHINAHIIMWSHSCIFLVVHIFKHVPCRVWWIVMSCYWCDFQNIEIRRWSVCLFLSTSMVCEDARVSPLRIFWIIDSNTNNLTRLCFCNFFCKLHDAKC